MRGDDGHLVPLCERGTQVDDPVPHLGRDGGFGKARSDSLGYVDGGRPLGHDHIGSIRSRTFMESLTRKVGSVNSRSGRYRI